MVGRVVSLVMDVSANTEGFSIMTLILYDDATILDTHPHSLVPTQIIRNIKDCKAY